MHASDRKRSGPVPRLPANPMTITPLPRVLRDGSGATRPEHLPDLRDWDNYDRATHPGREAAKGAIEAARAGKGRP
jgi:hypothetical protein